MIAIGSTHQDGEDEERIKEDCVCVCVCVCWNWEGKVDFFFNKKKTQFLKIYYYYFFIFFFVVNFVIHWNETAMGLHVFPILILPPPSFSTRSL